jgi:NAD(P)-dependent dehydrogenase (short-subunit alcohol dehydrogenase family)
MDLLKGKVALITGGGGGVGRGCAYALARDGCAVVVTGRTESKLQETVKTIEDFGGKAMGLVADVTKPDDVTNSVAETVKKYGGLDILLNNAVGEVYIGPLLQATEENFRAELEVGPIAVLRYMRAAYPHMKSRGGGTIINMISGTVTRWDARFYGVYSATKQAIRALTRSAACEWGVDGIRVLNVAPLSESPAMSGWIEKSPDEAKAFIATIPLGRIGNAEEDIGRAVMALCLPVNQYLTGCTVPLDGGQCLFS